MVRVRSCWVRAPFRSMRAVMPTALTEQATFTCISATGIRSFWTGRSPTTRYGSGSSTPTTWSWPSSPGTGGTPCSPITQACRRPVFYAPAAPGEPDRKHQVLARRDNVGDRIDGRILAPPVAPATGMSKLALTCTDALQHSAQLDEHGQTTPEACCQQTGFDLRGCLLGGFRLERVCPSGSP
jgi:hypothetical protein